MCAVMTHAWQKHLAHDIICWKRTADHGISER